MILGARPLKRYSATRRPLPSFPADNVFALQRIRDEYLPNCAGLVELVETVCEEREQWQPPVSYTLIGDVAIISLNREIRHRVRELAEELLSHLGVKAVYGKELTEGEYRVQRLIHLAGEKVDKVAYREHGLVYRIPLGKVYVNPRLSAEHYRIASQVRPRERVLDMFSGIGGFSLLISMMGRAEVVVANDANPWAIKTLLEAVRLNKHKLRTPILVLNLDARQLPSILRPVFTRIIMNLPHGAPEFMDVARSLCSPGGCVIHVYVVARSREEALALVPGATRAQRVLDYAPRKFIYRVDVVAKDTGH